MTLITWVTAVLCAAAVGARLGRLTVRPPSLNRTAVAVAAVAVTGAAAVRTPTVAVVLAPNGGDLPMLVFIGCWVIVGLATALIATSAWPGAGRRLVQAATVVISLAALAVLVVMGITGEMLAGSVFILMTSVFSFVAGVRYIGWHPLGRAIACYLVGIAVVFVDLVSDPTHTDPTHGGWAAAIIILGVACCLVMLEAWFNARVDLSATRRLSDDLLAAHPELADADYSSATPVLRADDRASQILDGLYLHAGAGLISADDDDSLRPRARARLIGAWLRTDDPTPINPGLLATPKGFTDRRWVRMIAREYGRAAPQQPAEQSPSPSESAS